MSCNDIDRRDEPLFGHQGLGIEGQRGYDGNAEPHMCRCRGGGLACTTTSIVDNFIIAIHDS